MYCLMFIDKDIACNAVYESEYESVFTSTWV